MSRFKQVLMGKSRFRKLSSKRIIVSDSFNRADNTTSLGTADTGQAWLPIIGTLGISSNKGYAFATGASLSVIDSKESNGIISVQFLYKSGDDLGLVFRCDGTNGNRITLNLSTTLGLQLTKKISNSTTVVASSALSLVDNQLYTLKVIYIGDNIVCYLDDVEKFNTSESIVLKNNTNHGIILYKAATVPASHYDNFKVEA